MKILITGGSGLVGKALSAALNKLGHEVCILTRKKRGTPDAKEFLWHEHFIEEGALENVDALVHLAGESIAVGRWTKHRKQKIISSRVDSLQFITDRISGCPVLVGASGTGFYGHDRGEEALSEESEKGTGFLAQCCELWEAGEKAFAKRHNSRLTIIRTAMVLSAKGGALPKMAAPFKYGLGVNLGTGNQWLSWIHLDDLVKLYVAAITDSSINGIVNGVAESPIRYADFNQALSKVFRKRIILPNVPSFLVKAALGEMSALVLGSLRVTSNRNQKYKYPNLDSALAQTY